MGKITRALATGAAALLLLTPAAAQARLDLYADNDYKGHIGWRDTTGLWNMSSANNNSLNSLKNQTPWGAAFYHGSNASGHCFDYMPWVNDPSFWWSDRDAVSSYGLGRRC